jgi:hypothetical protein
VDRHPLRPERLDQPSPDAEEQGVARSQNHDRLSGHAAPDIGDDFLQILSDRLFFSRGVRKKRKKAPAADQNIGPLDDATVM